MDNSFHDTKNCCYKDIYLWASRDMTILWCNVCLSTDAEKYFPATTTLQANDKDPISYNSSRFVHSTLPAHNWIFSLISSNLSSTLPAISPNRSQYLGKWTVGLVLLSYPRPMETPSIETFAHFYTCQCLLDIVNDLQLSWRNHLPGDSKKVSAFESLLSLIGK